MTKELKFLTGEELMNKVAEELVEVGPMVQLYMAIYLNNHGDPDPKDVTLAEFGTWFGKQYATALYTVIELEAENDDQIV